MNRPPAASGTADAEYRPASCVDRGPPLPDPDPRHHSPPRPRIRHRHPEQHLQCSALQPHHHQREQSIAATFSPTVSIALRAIISTPSAMLEPPIRRSLEPSASSTTNTPITLATLSRPGCRGVTPARTETILAHQPGSAGCVGLDHHQPIFSSRRIDIAPTSVSGPASSHLYHAGHVRSSLKNPVGSPPPHPGGEHGIATRS